jgi:hypothetical protein
MSDDDPIDFTPLYRPPDPARLDALAGRISASVAAQRRRPVLSLLVAWAPAAVAAALVLAALAWVPALTKPSPARTPAAPEVVLVHRAHLWFMP